MQISKRFIVGVTGTLLSVVLATSDAEDVKPFASVEGWGQVIDPVGDCKFEHDADQFTIKVPGEYHDLWPGKGKVNAPLVLRETDGDFSIEVLVADVTRAERGSVIPGLGSSVSFHSGTLVIWHDAKNFVRLDRTNMNNAGRAITSCYLQIFRDGDKLVEVAPLVPDKPTHLRLERRGNRVTSAYSQDGGTTWLMISSERVELPAKVKAGISALNNTNRPCEARFADLKLIE